MPRERQEFFRETKTREVERIVAIAFEGNKTEPQYFEAYKQKRRYDSGLLYVHLLKRDKDDTKSAPQHVLNKLKQEIVEEYNLGKGDELWMVIDTDSWDIGKLLAEVNKVNNSLKYKINIAVSNPCFELWLLLHIKDIEEYSQETRNKILKNPRQGKRNYIERLIIGINQSYSKNKLRTNDFIPHIDQAIEQARYLDKDSPDYPEGIGSHVYKLIESIEKK